MKFYLISFFIAFLAVSSLQAQHMNIGVKGGLNMYNVVNESGGNREPLLGFNLGLIGHFHLSDQFALQPEVVFSTQGAKFSNNGVESQLYLNYINVPVLLQYMFDNGFRLFAGPQLGFLISAKSNSNNTQMDMTSDFKGLEFGASLGVSYINPDSNLGIDARYNLGLTDINENNAEASYNRGFQLGLFFLFNHK